MNRKNNCFTNSGNAMRAAFAGLLVLWLLFVVAWNIGVTPAMAIGDPRLKNGRCPDVSLLEKLKETRGRGKGDQGEFSVDPLFEIDSLPEVTWVLDPNELVLSQEASEEGIDIDLSGVRVLDKVEIIAPSTNKEFWLVRIRRLDIGEDGKKLRERDILCGWLKANRKDGLLPWDDSGLILPIKQKDAPRRYKKEGSHIALKAVVHSLGGGGAVIPLYSEPSRTGKPWRYLRQFEILDVFAWKQDRATKNASRGRQKFYFLLGRKGAGGLPPDILGWAHEDDIAIWSTRITAFWTGQGGRAYENQRGGRVLLEGPVGEPDSGDSISRRYPVLTTYPGNERLSEIVVRQNLRPSDALRRIRSVLMVVPGQACRGSQCIPPEQLEAIRTRIQSKMRELNKIDIVFLIDGTRSMTRYFRAVARGVRDFVRNLRDTEGVRIRVAASIYGDYRGSSSGRRAVQYERVVPRHDPFDSEDIGMLLDRADEGYLRDPQQDKLEAPFAAILQTIADDTRWGEHKGLRYLVHIADHGNRFVGEGAQAGLTNGHEESVSLDDVVDALRTKRIVYVPIAVRGDGPGEAGRRFREQAAEISRKLEAYGRALKVVEEDVEGVAEEILRILEQVIVVRKEAISKLALVQACHERADVRDPEVCVQALKGGGDFKARLASAALERLGLLKEMSQVAGYVQRTLPVWVPPFQDDKQVIDFWLMLELERFQKLASLVGGLCRTFRPDNLIQGQMVLRNALVASLDLASGENQTRDGDAIGTSMSDVLSRQLFIPAWALSPIWGRPWRELNRYISQMRERQAKKWNIHFCRKYYLLKGIEGNKKVKDETTIKCTYDEVKKYNDCEAPKEYIRAFNWFYDYGPDQRFYFIPLRYLP